MRNRSVRKGITLVEIAIVLVLLGIVAGITYPSLASAMTQANARSAQTDVVALLARTRSVAVQRGARARLVRTGNVFNVTVETPGGFVTVGGDADLHEAYTATVSSSRNVIEFDPRGVAVGLGGAVDFTITQGTTVKHVCVRRLGNVQLGECA